jgi:cleavage and polyadenylation specificity factor subunit 3
MSAEIIFLGGVEEIGANSCYIYMNGTGIIFDAGLHPRKRNKDLFPKFEYIAEKPADLLVISHAHTDHIGAIPYLLKFQPHLKLLSTQPTIDLASIMLKDTAKILKSEAALELGTDVLSIYQPETIQKIDSIMESIDYYKKLNYCGRAGLKDVDITFYPAGHILGSASVKFESNGYSILQTSDVNFIDQNLIPKADLPKHHLNTLIIECTNAADMKSADYKMEKKKLAAYINQIANNNGSILIPAFVLGKTQEILKILYDLMRKGSIPHLPIYTKGLSQKISKVYDHYCYAVPMMEPGFEVSDIPQRKLYYHDLNSGLLFKESSIVVVPSGMIVKDTISHRLALKFFKEKNSGIAIVGYQDESTPGWQLQNSQKDIEFLFGNKKIKRVCNVEKFRFTSHALIDDILTYINEVKPNNLFIIHGDKNASENLAAKVSEMLPETTVIIPEIGYSYKFD